MSGILVEITSTDFEGADFLWYWVYSNPAFIDGDDATVIAGCSGKNRVEGDYFPHVGLTPGDEWHYWVQGAYGERTSPVLSALTYLGHDTAPPNNGSATAPAILGRNTTGTGPVEVLSPATVKTMLGAGDAGGLATLDGTGLIPSTQIPAIITDTTTALSLQNSWAAVDGWTAQVRQYGKMVQVQGLITGGTASNTTLIATLPAGCLPAQDMYFDLATGDNAEAQAKVATNGQITIYTTWTSTYVSLDAIAFLTA
jgi:hypothetical protein